ncbi:hypothetical protein HRbin11_02139 [bacterium HR11]|nr:hypothetical protein HRbin11_02139 [bacterium HR11]
MSHKFLRHVVMPSRRHVGPKLLRLAAWGLLGIAGIRWAFFVVREVPRPRPGLVALYTAARLVRAGNGVERFYDDEWFQTQVRRVTPTVRDIYRPNPPTAVLLGWPLVVLGIDYVGARWVWSVFSTACVLGAVGLLMRADGLQGAGLPLALAGLLSYHPWKADLALGQVYGLLLGLLTLAWYGYRRDRPAVLGTALGLLLAFKMTGLLLWPLLAVQRRWRALAWAAGTALAVIGLSLPWLGAAAWWAYGSVLLHLTDHPSLAVTAYQTQLGFCRHLFAPDPVWNPAPLGVAPWLSDLLWAASVLGFLGGSLYAAGVGGSSDAAFAAFTVAGVILNPYALDYHYTLLVLPILVLLASGLRKPAGPTMTVLTAAILLTGLNLPYRSPALAVGAWALLAYPKLYGAWLLWGLAIWMAVRRRDDSRLPRRTPG